MLIYLKIIVISNIMYNLKKIKYIIYDKNEGYKKYKFK